MPRRAGELLGTRRSFRINRRAIRTRMLLTVALLVSIAVFATTSVFNLLRESIDGDASALAQGRAAAELATVQFRQRQAEYDRDARRLGCGRARVAV